ncbi:hypothetical protein HPB51_005180 [Rhipicephalus microplus]|uniref:Uncharacterized protein n=1 Tax=Rhipicephalus microplus TaxID=6941 RepID=A0A9J6DZ14_RHIMP|nr:hypothetical protein HPB51_005180 [Rhipicephalus microplus]
MSESSLPAVYIKKEAKRLKVYPLYTVTAARKQKRRKEDAVYISKPLFDRPTAAILKMRCEAKLLKVKNLMVYRAGQLLPPPPPQRPDFFALTATCPARWLHGGSPDPSSLARHTRVADS